MKHHTFRIIEFQVFGERECGSKNFFDALISFSQSEGNERFLKHHKKSGNDYLKAQNYVGAIQTKFGTLEILPKCFDTDSLTQESKESSQIPKHEYREKLSAFFKIETFANQVFKEDEERANYFQIYQDPITSSKNFLIFCLKILKKTHLKHTKTSSIDTAHTPLIEIFIQMFCNEILSLVSKGVRHDYVAIEENRSCLKGKLLFNQHIKHNLTHKERFFTRSDEHLADIAPNRLIKSTLLLIKSFATSHRTHRLIHRSLKAFEEIPQSTNIKADFLSCRTSRHFGYYDDVLASCKLFLEGKSFAAFSGESKAYALLFPMEKLFETYVAHMLTHSNSLTHTIQTQKSNKYLLSAQKVKEERFPKNLFQLKVDLYIEPKEGEKIVADTKWKTLKSTEDKKHGISQNDLYQLFVYAKYHQAKEVWLIYPKPYSQNEKMMEVIAEWNERGYLYLYSDENQDNDKDKNIALKIIFAPLMFC